MISEAELNSALSSRNRPATTISDKRGFYIVVGSLVHSMRLASGALQEDVAAAGEISQATYSRAERGGVLSAYSLAKILAFFGRDIGEFHETVSQIVEEGRLS